MRRGRPARDVVVHLAGDLPAQLRDVECHTAAAVGGLDFSDPDRGYSSLTRLWVCQPADGRRRRLRVVNGTPICEQMFRPRHPYTLRVPGLVPCCGPATPAHAVKPPPRGRHPPQRDLILNGATKMSIPTPAMDAATDGSQRQRQRWPA
jgi:hypothetical protein